jgi:PAS domain S-box-containing protein
VGPWEWDLVTGAFKIDPGTLRKLGYALDEIAPTIDAWDALMHPDDHKTVQARFRDVDKPTAETFEAVYRMRMKQGGWRWLLTRARAIQRDAAGHPTRIIGTHLDITDVKKTEIALRRSEERFRSLAESSRAVPWEADISTFQITYVGPQIERVTGYSPTDWVEKDLWPQRLHPEDRDRAMKEVDILAKEALDHNLEYRLIAADGRVVWIRDMISVIKSDDGQRWLYGVMVDVTEGKQREQALRERATISTSRTCRRHSALVGGCRNRRPVEGRPYYVLGDVGAVPGRCARRTRHHERPVLQHLRSSR